MPGRNKAHIRARSAPLKREALEPQKPKPVGITRTGDYGDAGRDGWVSCWGVPMAVSGAKAGSYAISVMHAGCVADRAILDIRQVFRWLGIRRDRRVIVYTLPNIGRERARFAALIPESSYRKFPPPVCCSFLRREPENGGEPA